jgi:hypothetical protein
LVLGTLDGSTVSEDSTDKLDTGLSDGSAVADDTLGTSCRSIGTHSRVTCSVCYPVLGRLEATICTPSDSFEATDADVCCSAYYVFGDAGGSGDNIPEVT